MLVFENVIKAIPYLFIACMCLAFYIVVRHINGLRKKNLEDEIKLGEKQIEDHVNSLSDDEFVSELNKRTVPTINSPEDK